MWWSTVVYFDKSPESKLFFDLWAHIADNYNYYQFLYNFPLGLFRTDYCVSIAAHILDGMTAGDYVSNFGNAIMQNLGQKDDIVKINTVTDWACLAYDTRENWKNIVVRHDKYDVHVMNKRALDRMLPKIRELNDGI